MSNRMTVDYETVVYNYGNMDGKSPGDIVTGFGDPATYDTELSPISNPGSNEYALGQGGLVQASGGSINSPTRGNPLAASDAQYAAYTNSQTTSGGTPGGTNTASSTVRGALDALAIQSQQQQNTGRNNPFYFATVDYSAFTPAGQPTVPVPNPGSTTLPPTDLITPVTGIQYAAADIKTTPDFNFANGNGI